MSSLRLRVSIVAPPGNGQRSSHSGVPYVQSLGPARPIVLPRGAKAYSRHLVLRLALLRAVRTDSCASRLGGISYQNSACLKRSVLRALTGVEKTRALLDSPEEDAALIQA